MNHSITATFTRPPQTARGWVRWNVNIAILKVWFFLQCLTFTFLLRIKETTLTEFLTIN